jgi:hypothetical protein
MILFQTAAGVRSRPGQLGIGFAAATLKSLAWSTSAAVTMRERSLSSLGSVVGNVMRAADRSVIDASIGDPAHELRVVELFQALDFHNYPDYRYTGPDGSQVVKGNRDGSWAVEGEELVPWGHFASPSVRLLINTKATHFRVYMRNASMAWSDPRGCALFRLIVRDPTDAQRVRPMVPDE